VPHRREADVATGIYDEALAFFTADSDDTDVRVIERLRRARQLDPWHEDSLELLGVALQRRGALPEATALMERLIEQNPESLMGWTNLSRFYAEAGKIDEAEVAQGRAIMLSFKRDLADRKAAAAETQRKVDAGQERQGRMGMFREVLEFDPDDLVALFGLGQAHRAEEEPQLAVELLQHAVEVKADYAAAWLELGRCQEDLGDLKGARLSYEQGIAAAARRGELMPMRAMEQRLKALES
jgi:tetratricopeptide (TPR) repeat protein